MQCLRDTTVALCNCYPVLAGWSGSCVSEAYAVFSNPQRSSLLILVPFRSIEAGSDEKDPGCF